jgi:hypothetical protein
MRLNLSKLERVPLREAWKHEAGDFTPWLAEEENLNALADALGLSELELVAIEHPVGDFKLDIFCTDGDDPVIIENQLERTNHSHLGQILAYAAGVGAKKVIWVAEAFRPEHASAMQFLNDHTIEDLAFFGVEVELWRIGDSPLAPKFEVVVRPNDWVRSGREQVRAASTASTTKQLQLKFWGTFVDHLKSHAPQIRPQKARPQHWLNIAIGRSGAKLVVTFNSRSERLGTELYLYGEGAKQTFAALLERRNEVEASLGFELDWQELPEAKACRIAIWYGDAPLENEARWPEYMAWAERQVMTLDRVLRPILSAMP